MEQIVISGSGVFTPEESITNKELVKAYNTYADIYNSTNKSDISQGNKVALELSSEEFIYKASKLNYKMHRICSTMCNTRWKQFVKPFQLCIVVWES